MIVDIDWDLDTDTGIFLHCFFVPFSPLFSSHLLLEPIPKTFVILLDEWRDNGAKWTVAKAAATHLLHQLHSNDLFTILPFTHKIDVPSFTSPQLATYQNKKKAEMMIDAMRLGGASDLASAVQGAFSLLRQSDK